jgi:hypothetical protein
VPLLLEDLAEEASASNLRTAERLDAEARELEQLCQAVSAHDELRERTLESARQATEHVLARIPQAEGAWRSALTVLRTKPNDECVRLLQHLISAFESGQRLARAPRALWKVAEQFNVPAENLDKIESVERRFAELAAEASAALAYRTEGRRPADPERLARGLELARKRETATADAARARFQRPAQ